MTTEKYAPVGGTTYPVLYVTVGAGQRVEPGQSTMMVKAVDEYEDYEGDPDVEAELGGSLSAGGWQIRQSDGTWVSAGTPPASADNLNGADTRAPFDDEARDACQWRTSGGQVARPVCVERNNA